MRRDEAFAKATETLSGYEAEVRARLEKRNPYLIGPALAPQDWAQPSIHQVIVALEAIGVVKFDSEPACPFKVNDPVRNKNTKYPLGKVAHVIDSLSVTLDQRPGMWHVGGLELDAPFEPGDKVRFKDRRAWLSAFGNEPGIWTVARVTPVSGVWDIEIAGGAHYGPESLEHVKQPPPYRMIYLRVGAGLNSETFHAVAADVAIEALEAAGYTVRPK